MSEEKTIAVWKEIPEDQKLLITLKPKHPNALIRASLLGATVRNMGRVLKSFLDDNSYEYETFVTDIGMNEDGSIEIEFSLLPIVRDE